MCDTEANALEDWHEVDRYDDENRLIPTHEVVVYGGRVVFTGSREACWAYKKHHGGFVQIYVGDYR